MTSESLLPKAFPLLAVLVFTLGCCIGSFLNVVIWRLPRGEFLSYPGSHCPNCNHAIRPWENIPIFSWLFLRGKCSCCRQPISVRYPLGEAACGILYLLVFCIVWREKLPLAMLPTCFFAVGAFLSASWIDVQHRLIPDKITYSGLVVFPVLSAVWPASRPWLVHWVPLTRRNAVCDALAGMLAALLLCLFFYALTRLLQRIAGRLSSKTATESSEAPAPLGRGDVKFLMMIGAALGVAAVPAVLAYGALLGFSWGLILGVFRRRLPISVPWAPFLGCVAFYFLIRQSIL